MVGTVSGAVPTDVLGSRHHLHVIDDVIPALRAAGVTEDQVKVMLVENTRRYFSRCVCQIS
jgi:phosphotriesterase-related protein